MAFDLSTAFAVREREDGLLEKDTFDLGSAVPVEEIIRAAKLGEIPYSPPAIKERANVELAYKEAGLEVPSGLRFEWELTSPQKQAAVSAALSTAVTGGLYPVVQAVRGLADKDGKGNIFDRVFKGIVYPEAMARLYQRLPGTKDLPPWAKITADIADDIISYGVTAVAKGAIKESLLIKDINRKLDIAATVFAKEKSKGMLPAGPVAEENTFNEFKQQYRKIALEKLSAVEAELVEAENLIGTGQGGGVSQLQEYARKRSLVGLIIDDLKHMNASGQIKIPQIGQTIGFKNPQGITEIGKILDVTENIVKIELENAPGRIIVATLSQLSLPKVEQPTEGKVEITTMNVKDLEGVGTNLPVSSADIEKARDVSKVEPIIISKEADGTIRMIDGSHRLSAMKAAGIKDIPVIIQSTPTGEGQRPPIEPPKTAVSGGPEEDYNKLFKNYVRATPVGKVLTKSANIKQEIANEDFLIKTYESDITKLERQIELGEYQVEAEKAKAQIKLEKMKQEYTLAKETQKQRKTYRDEVKDLVKDIQDTPKENIAIEYQDMIEQLQSKFDLKRVTEKTEAKRESMKVFVERMKVEGRPITIPADKLAMMDKVTLNEMTLDQLRDIKKTIDNLKTLGKTKLKAREAVYVAKKEKAKNQLLKEVTPIESRKLKKLPIGERHSTWIKKVIALQNYAQKTGVGLTPIDGLADVTGMTKMKEVLDTDFSKYLTYNDKIIKEWYDLTKDLTDRDFNRIGVVAASRQVGGLERLANSGITKKEIKTIKLTPIEEKVYQFVLDAFDKEYPAVKQYSKEVYNTDVGEQENYVSFMSDYEQISDLEIYQRFGQTPEQVAKRRTKTVEQGFTKERAKVSNIKLETNIDKIFRRHMDDVAYMLSTGKNIKMYFEIVNSPEMHDKLGDVGTLAWLQYLDLMARKGGTEGGQRIALLDLIRRNIGAGVLSFRLSSALVQFSSFSDTIATIGPEWATRGASALSSREWRNFIMDNFPEIRKAVGDDIAFREFGEGTLARLANVGLKPLQFLDGLMRSTAAAGSYQKLCAEKGIIVDLKNPDKDLIIKSTTLMRNSQGSSFFKDQPLAITAGYGLTDNKAVNKTILTFQSFMLNRWDNINRQIWRTGIKEKDYGKVISSLFWLMIFAGAVEEGIRRGSRKVTNLLAKDPREEKGFLGNTLLNMVQSVPLLGQLVSSIVYSSNPVPVINTLEDLLEGIKSTTIGKEPETKIKGVIRTVGALGSSFGVAGANQFAQILRSMVGKKKSIQWY